VELHNVSTPLWIVCGTTSKELGDWYDGAQLAMEPHIAVSGDDVYITQVWHGRRLFIEVDGVRHDAHINEETFKLKTHAYRGINMTPRQSRVMEDFWSKQAVMTARSASGVKIVAPGHQVRTGNLDTSIGNGVVSGTLAMLTSRTIAAQPPTTSFGDLQDSVVRELSRFGYKAEIHVTTFAAETTFLSGLFVPSDVGTRWAPKPGRLIARLGVLLPSDPSVAKKPLVQDQMLAGSIRSFLPYRWVPFLGVVVRWYEALLNDVDATNYKPWRQVAAEGDMPAAASAETWSFFNDRYGLSAADEANFANGLSRLTRLPCVYHDYVTARLIEVDL
jgi:hypothetical protein